MPGRFKPPRGQHVPEEWSVGVFLVRLGTEPKGIAASGSFTTSNIVQKAHWDGTPGKKANYASLSWDRVVTDDKALGLSVLQAKMADVHWTPHTGGTLVSAPYDAELETLWSNHIGHTSGGTQLRAGGGTPRLVKDGRMILSRGNWWKAMRSRCSRRSIEITAGR
jgi:hypothetical protein